MPRGSLVMPVEDLRSGLGLLTAFALKDWKSSVYLDTCDSPTAKKNHTYPASSMLCMYQLFTVIVSSQ